MKNYFEHRGVSQKLTFNPISKQFVTCRIPHPFTQQTDPLEQHLLMDLGIDAAALEHGKIKFAA